MGACPDCAAAAPPLLWRAVEEFNQGRFFDCHETIEELWRAEHGPLRNFYKGLIQIAAGFVQVQRGHRRGALRLFFRGLTLIEPYPSPCLGIDNARLVAEVQRCREELLNLGGSAAWGADRFLKSGPSTRERPWPWLCEHSREGAAP